MAIFVKAERGSSNAEVPVDVECVGVVGEAKAALPPITRARN
jgi:hypothetical protein